MLRAVLLASLLLPTLLQAEERDIPFAKMNPLLSVETQSPLMEMKLSVEITDDPLSFEAVSYKPLTLPTILLV